MPRTKQPVKTLKVTEGDDEKAKKLNKLVTEQYNKIDSRSEKEIRDLKLAFKILLSSISPEYTEKQTRQLKTELALKEVTNSRHRTVTRNSGRAASHDDGYLTDGSSLGSGGKGTRKTPVPPRTVGRSGTTNRRSRSAGSSRLPTTTRPQRRRSRSVYRTPAYNKHATVTYPTITPKVTPQTPLTILRQPRQGEMVLSMSGSPVMVPTCYAMQPDEKANCNILLKDGTMLSMQPKQLRQSQDYIPYSLMDMGVMNQLKTLYDNLDTVLKQGQEIIGK